MTAFSVGQGVAMAVGRGLTQAGAGGGAFDPATLFAGGELGAWYDPSDFSSMFQDTAGTVPVTATGQAVARINDKSGRGNHATQATAANRPLLQQDGGGNYYLDFDGVNDGLATSAINFSTTDKMTVWAGVRKSSDAAVGILVELSVDALSNNGAFYISAPDNAASNYGIALRGTANAAYRATTYAAPITNVLAVSFDIAGAAIANEIVPRINALSPTLTASIAGPAGTGNFGNHALYIGRRAGASIPMAGRIYSLIVRGLATADVSPTEIWVASKTGVTL